MDRYETYKYSGVEWIGEIPKEWEVKKLKYILSISNGEGIKSEEIKDFGDYPVYGGNGLVGYTTEFNNEDDVFVIGRVGAKCGNIRFISGKKWISDNALLAYASGNSKYIEFFMTALDLNKLSNKNAQPLITSSMIKEQYIFLPPQDEQAAIASYLDRKTAEIDALIAQKQRLIELYQEEKTAIINQAVTKGIDPNAKLKDSGINWLGEIPVAWEVIALKRLTSKITDGEHISPIFTQCGMPFLSAKDVRDGFINLPDDKFVDYDDGARFRKRCNPELNDILLVSRGATVGRVAIVNTDTEFCLLGSVILLKPNVRINPSYLFYSLKNKLVQDHFLHSSQSSAQQAIYLVDVATVYLAIPNPEEQTTIVHHIETETTRINAKIAKTQRIIELQKEYRTALISEVVTGKIKVPNTATLESRL